MDSTEQDFKQTEETNDHINKVFNREEIEETQTITEEQYRYFVEDIEFYFDKVVDNRISIQLLQLTLIEYIKIKYSFFPKVIIDEMIDLINSDLYIEYLKAKDDLKLLEPSEEELERFKQELII